MTFFICDAVYIYSWVPAHPLGTLLRIYQIARHHIVKDIYLSILTLSHTN
jgi:hypothetical protein